MVLILVFKIRFLACVFAGVSLKSVKNPDKNYKLSAIKMIKKTPEIKTGNLLFPDLINQLNPDESYLRLARKIPWDKIETAFAGFYAEKGRPAKEIRLMTGLLIIKRIENLSDDEVIAHWIKNPYFQAFRGETIFQWRPPRASSDLTHFRERIGEKGADFIFKISIELHGAKAVSEDEIIIDSTAREKNITFPTDYKMVLKIIDKCRVIAAREKLKFRRGYRFTAKKLKIITRFRSQPKQMKKVKAADRKLKTIAFSLIREISHRLPANILAKYQQSLDLFTKVLKRTKNSKNKIYSLHEPLVACFGKGEAHKKYEFGSKASIAITKTTNIIVAAKSFSENLHDTKTLADTISRVIENIGKYPTYAICDRGYRGLKKSKKTFILIPGSSNETPDSGPQKIARKRFRRRAAIEPIIGHLKSDFRLAINFLKGSLGDSINLLLSAAAFNFNKMLKELASLFFVLFFLRVTETK